MFHVCRQMMGVFIQCLFFPGAVVSTVYKVTIEWTELFVCQCWVSFVGYDNKTMKINCQFVQYFYL